MTISAPSGIPRIPKGQNDSSKQDQVAKEKEKAAYHAREMDEKARKDREEIQRQLLRQKQDLELKELDLQTLTDKRSALLREIARLTNRPVDSVPVKATSILDTRNLERQNASAIDSKNKQIAAIEKEIQELNLGIEVKEELTGEAAKKAKVQEENRKKQIIQKEKEDEAELKQITKIKEGIRLKTQELNKFDLQSSLIQQEIDKLKSQPTVAVSEVPEETNLPDASDQQRVAKVAEKKGLLEKLKAELNELRRVFEQKKQEIENRIKTSEQELVDLDRTPKKNTPAKVVKKPQAINDVKPLISKKEREKEKVAKQVTETKEAIRIQNMELEKALSVERSIQHDIVQLKNQSKGLDSTKSLGKAELSKLQQDNNAKIAEKQRQIEKIRAEILGISQGYESKKQEVAMTNKNLQDNLRQVEERKRVIQEKEQEAELVLRRVNGINDDIKHIQGLIRDLESKIRQ